MAFVYACAERGINQVAGATTVRYTTDLLDAVSPVWVDIIGGSPDLKFEAMIEGGNLERSKTPVSAAGDKDNAIVELGGSADWTDMTLTMFWKIVDASPTTFQIWDGFFQNETCFGLEVTEFSGGGSLGPDKEVNVYQVNILSMNKDRTTSEKATIPVVLNVIERYSHAFVAGV